MSSVDSKHRTRAKPGADVGDLAGDARADAAAGGPSGSDLRLGELFDQASSSLHRAVAALEPECLTGADAQKLFTSVVEVLRLAIAAKLALATRIESSNIWRDAGHKNAASLIAETEGVGVGQAQATLETGKALADAPETAEALREAKLSEPQVKELAGAVAVDPGHESELVKAAQGEPMAALRDRCRKTRARAASADPDATLAAIHADRHLRHWTDEQGAFCLRGRFTPDRGAQLLSVLDAATTDRFNSARRDGDREPRAAYAADALVELLCGDSSRTGRPKTIVNVRVDHEALFNREARGNEVSEIDGVGEVPVRVIESLLSDAYLKVLFYKGTEVHTISHPGRYINAPIRTALANDNPCCAVPGCGATTFLEIDHIQPVNDQGPTTLSNLVRLCSWHHDKKTNAGYVVYKDDNGNWHFDPPKGPEPLPPLRHEPDLEGDPGGALFDPNRHRNGQADTTNETESGTDPPSGNSKPSNSKRDNSKPSNSKPSAPPAIGSGRSKRPGRARSGDNGESPPLFDLGDGG